MSRPTILAAALDLPLHRPFRTSRGAKTVASNVLVEIHHEGVVGRGEGAPNPRYGQSQESSLEALFGFDTPDASPLDHAAWLESFDDAFPGETAARCALELALWDWSGRHLRKPVRELLGIHRTGAPPSSWTISIDSLAEIRSRVREAESWPILKIKLGGGDGDRAAVEALREVTDRPFRVDANEAWEFEETLENLEWLAGMGCELVEQPLPAGRLDEVAMLRQKSPLPLVADEDVLADTDIVALSQAYDIVNVKLTRLGGLTPAVRWIHAARSHGMGVMIGCFVESSVGISAAAQLAPLADHLDLDGAALLASDPFRGSGVAGGRLRFVEAPGLGVDPAGASG